MAKIRLGISWLNGSLKLAVAAVEAGGIARSWASPTPVVSIEQFAAGLSQAIREFRCKAREASLVLDHPDLVFDLQETPPGRERLVRRMIDRTIRKARFFEEPAAWNALPLPPARGFQRHLLTLLPHSIIDAIDEACDEQGLQLAAVVPPAAILARSLQSIPVAPGGAVLLIAGVEGVLNLLAGAGDGRVLLARRVPCTGREDRERARQEIHRTLLYLRQQFSVEVSEVWLFGHVAKELLGDAALPEGATLQRCTDGGDDFHYAREAAGIQAGSPINLLSKSGPQRRRFQRLCAISAAAALIASGFVTLSTECLVRARERQVKALAAQESQLAARQGRLRESYRALKQAESALKWLGTGEFPATPEPFLRHLSTSLPGTLALTHIDLARTNSSWRVRVEATGSDADLPLLTMARSLETNLLNSPLNLRMTDSTSSRLLSSPPPDEQRQGFHPLRDARQRTFFITGFLE